MKPHNSLAITSALSRQSTLALALAEMPGVTSEQCMMLAEIIREGGTILDAVKADAPAPAV